MAPVKLAEINISQCRSDNNKERWGDVCWNPYFHKPSQIHPDASVWFSMHGQMGGLIGRKQAWSDVKQTENDSHGQIKCLADHMEVNLPFLNLMWTMTKPSADLKMFSCWVFLNSKHLVQYSLTSTSKNMEYLFYIFILHLLSSLHYHALSQLNTNGSTPTYL